MAEPAPIRSPKPVLVRNYSLPSERSKSVSAPVSNPEAGQGDLHHLKATRAQSVGGLGLGIDYSPGPSSSSMPTTPRFASSSTLPVGTPPPVLPPRSSKRSPSGPLTPHADDSHPQHVPRPSSPSSSKSPQETCFPTSESIQSLTSNKSRGSTASFGQIVFRTDLPSASTDPSDFYSPVHDTFPQHSIANFDVCPAPTSPTQWTAPCDPPQPSLPPPPTSASLTTPTTSTPSALSPSTWRFPLFSSTPVPAPSPSSVTQPPASAVASLHPSPKVTDVDVPPTSYLSPDIDPTGPIPKRRASSGVYTPPTFPGPARHPKSPSQLSGDDAKRVSGENANAARGGVLGLGFAFSGLGLGYPSSPSSTGTPSSPAPPSASSPTVPSFLSRGRSWLGGSLVSPPATSESSTSSVASPYFSSLLSPSLTSTPMGIENSSSSSLPLSPGGTLSPSGVYTPASFYTQQQQNGLGRIRSSTGASVPMGSSRTTSPRVMTPLTPTSANMGRKAATIASPSSISTSTPTRKPLTSSPARSTPTQTSVKRKPVPLSSPPPPASIPLPATPTLNDASTTSCSSEEESTPSLLTSSSSVNSLSTSSTIQTTPSNDSYPNETKSASTATEHSTTRPGGGRDILSEMVGMGGGKKMVTLEVDMPMEDTQRVW